MRFAGQLRDGFLLERTEPGERDKLAPLHKVISPEPVLRSGVAELIRATADHYAGSFADVIRTAVPPRHAATEKAEPPDYPAPHLEPVAPHCLTSYPAGDRFLAELATAVHGRRGRCCRQLDPRATGPWGSSRPRPRPCPVGAVPC